MTNEAEERARRPRIYAASRASVPERPAMWQKLRSEGASIVSSWIDEAAPGASADISELWVRIAREIASADRLVLYVEEGDFPLKGALVEVGMALGMGKEVWIVAPGVELEPRSFRPLGSWAKHPNCHFCTSMYDATRCSNFVAARAASPVSAPRLQFVVDRDGEQEWAVNIWAVVSDTRRELLGWYPYDTQEEAEIECKRRIDSFGVAPVSAEQPTTRFFEPKFPAATPQDWMELRKLAAPSVASEDSATQLVLPKWAHQSAIEIGFDIERALAIMCRNYAASISEDWMRKGFDSLWTCLPTAYSAELKDLYRNVYEAGARAAASQLSTEKKSVSVLRQAPEGK